MKSLLEHSEHVRQKGRRWRKIRNIVFLVLLSGLIGWGAIMYYYPYSEGVKSGKLNYVVYQGVAFKTYEGKLILTDNETVENEDGNRSGEFVFSVAKKSIALTLMQSGGKTVELHYKAYFKAPPWRGKSKYVVDEIVGISEEKEIYEKEDVLAVIQ